MSDNLNQLITIIADTLDEDAADINAETTANDIEEWDSLNHIQIIVAVEKHFGVKFSLSDIQNFENVGAIERCIAEKLQ